MLSRINNAEVGALVGVGMNFWSSKKPEDHTTYLPTLLDGGDTLEQLVTDSDSESFRLSKLVQKTHTHHEFIGERCAFH